MSGLQPKVIKALATVLLFWTAGVSHAEEKVPEAKDEEARGQVTEVKPAARGIQDRYRNISNDAYALGDVAKVGEKLVYQVRWKGIPGGLITMRAKRTKRVGKRKALSLEMNIESNDFVSVFYEVNSTITSLAYTDTGASILMKRKLAEGRRRVDDRLQFDYEHVNTEGLVEPVSRYSKVNKGETKSSNPRPIPGPLQDSLSVVYYMRHLRFAEIGEEHLVLIGSRKRVDIVSIKAKEFARRRTPYGLFDCVVVEPKGEEKTDRTNIVAAKGAAKIYLEKSTGIPVFLSVAVPIGNATAELISAENVDLSTYMVQDMAPELEE